MLKPDDRNNPQYSTEGRKWGSVKCRLSETDAQSNGRERKRKWGEEGVCTVYGVTGTKGTKGPDPFSPPLVSSLRADAKGRVKISH